MNENQKIKSGDESNNYQARGDITINNGLSYSEVKEVSMSVFKENFLTLGDEIKDLVEARAEKVVDDYLKELRETDPNSLVKTVDPDIRANIYEAQRSYVRRGNDDIEALLIKALVERTVENENEFKNIIMNEAIALFNKLTLQQVQRLTIIFMAFSISFPDSFETYVDFHFRLYRKLFEQDNVLDRRKDLLFLQHLGCISISIGNKNICDIINRKFNRNYDKNMLNNQPEKIKLFFQVFEDRSNGYENSTISPVGSAIAITYLKKCGVSIDYETFL